MKINTRDTIIATASELFYNKGYNLTGINEIIDKAGIAKATLYNHFKSKEDLCVDYLDTRDKELMDSIVAFCNSKPKGDSRLLAVLEFLLPFFNQENFNGCWCIRTLAEIPRENKVIKAKIKSNKQRLQKFILNLVKENKPEISMEKQVMLTKYIYLLYEGAITESHLQESDWPIQANIKFLKLALAEQIIV